ncbi:MAG: type I restriction enzyme HsdR N-terminal domain-containing protein [Paludibacteraceae bacterium]
MKQRISDNKEQVFCEWRRMWVRLTPEEWVRQQFLHRLVADFRYPASLIGVEIPIRVGDAQKRCDAIVYTPRMQPIMLIEFKAEHVPLTQKVLDQAVIYNRRLCVPYLVLHNGAQTIIAHIAENTVQFLTTLPSWNQLLH